MTTPKKKLPGFPTDSDPQFCFRGGLRRLKDGILTNFLFIAASISLSLAVGCGTTTNRIATEQLLMSDAVDRAVSTIDFSSLTGKKVFVDTLFLHSVKGVGFVNSEYIISSLRQQLTASRCLLQDTRESADVIVEPRVGALGTHGHEIVYGIPQSGALNSAAKAFASSPLPAIPEISFGKANSQAGIAKIIVYAYDRESREPVWQSGIAKAESTSRDTWFLGAGPFQKGSIYEGMRFAGNEIQQPHLPPPPRWQNPSEQIADAKDPSESNPDSTISFNDRYDFSSELDSIGTIHIEPALKPDQLADDKSSSNEDDEKIDSKVVPASHEESSK